MYTRKHLLIASLMFFLFSTGHAQVTDWMPIPYEQTSYFQNGSDEIIPMEIDWYYPGGAGDFYGVHYQYLMDAFDTCAFAIWDPNYNEPPGADFRMYRDQFYQISIQSANYNDYYVSLDAQVGDWDVFGYYTATHLDSIQQTTILGTADTVRYYSVFEYAWDSISQIYILDSINQKGELALSKEHGLVRFTSFKYYDNDMQGDATLWSLIGVKDAQGSAGTILPGKSDYMPYSIGDEVVFKHTYWENIQNATETLEYHHLSITDIEMGSGVAEIYGVCAIYDEQGFYIETDYNYSLAVDPMLQEATDHIRSVPYESAADGGLFTTIDWAASSQLGIEMVIDGRSHGFCDTAFAVDGPSRTETYTTAFGVMDIHLHGYRPPTRWTLIAADMNSGTYGDWPQWLGTQHITRTNRVKVFPVPASDQLNIQSTSTSSLQVEIWSPLGQRVLSQRINAKESVDVSSLTQGAYILKYESEEVSGSQAVLIQR